MRILLLTDDDGRFYESTRYPAASMTSEVVADTLRSRGLQVEISRFGAQPWKRDLAGWGVLYQSSQDPDLYYKSFIEDVLLALQLRGAVLIPRFELFRAHHNKVFMEMLLESILGREGRAESWAYGGLSDFQQDRERLPTPFVIKTSEGAGSVGVKLCESRLQACYWPARFSFSPTPISWIKDRVKHLVRSHHYGVRQFRRKFVCQELIPGLTGDYKVVAYGTRFWILRRDVRPGDFRASGSGRFARPESPPRTILDFADRIREASDAPFISLDIALSHETPFLLEAQYVSFGNLTVETATHYFEKTGGAWERRRFEGEDIELILGHAVADHIERFGRRQRGAVPMSPA